MVKEHALTDKEREVLRTMSTLTGPLFAQAFQIFLKGSLGFGFSEEVSIGALAQYNLALLCRLIAMTGGVEDDVVLGDGMEDVVVKIQEFMATEMSAFIKAHSSEDPDDEDEGYVSPEQQKQDTAAEKADYTLDQMKEERSKERRG